MNRLKNILIGVDFSAGSSAALAQAMRMAQWNQARLQVLHVVNIMAVREYAEAMERPLMLVEKEVGAAMGERLELWLAGTQVAVKGEAVVGMPLDVLLRRSAELEASLLVLGLHDETTGGETAGNLAVKCLRKAKSKVMLVHPGQEGPFRRLVACVDFSESSREAVQQALRVGEQDQSEIHFIHVFSQSWRQLPLAVGLPVVTSGQEREYRNAQESHLREFVGETRGLKVSYAVVDSGSVFQGIADYARNAAADLLILGSRGQSALKYVMLGSTVERLLNHLPCSVLVVRAPQLEGSQAPAPAPGVP